MRTSAGFWEIGLAPCGLDLPGGDTTTFGRFQAEISERHIGTARGDPGVTSLLLLAELAA